MVEKSIKNITEQIEIVNKNINIQYQKLFENLNDSNETLNKKFINMFILIIFNLLIIVTLWFK